MLFKLIKIIWPLHSFLRGGGIEILGKGSLMPSSHKEIKEETSLQDRESVLDDLIIN